MSDVPCASTRCSPTAPRRRSSPPTAPSTGCAYPRFDSTSVFARLLDDGAGHFRIAPASSASTSTRKYRRSSLVLDTTWSGPDGELSVSDAMALGARERGHQLGQAAPGVLLRNVRCIRGEVALTVKFVPRPESGWSTRASPSPTA